MGGWFFKGGGGGWRGGGRGNLGRDGPNETRTGRAVSMATEPPAGPLFHHPTGGGGWGWWVVVASKSEMEYV